VGSAAEDHSDRGGIRARELAAKARPAAESSAERRPPEVNATIARAAQSLRDSGAGSDAPRAGSKAPDFALPSVRGAVVRLGDLLARGPAVLAFYRGVW